MIIYEKQTEEISINIYNQKKSTFFIVECFIKKPPYIYYLVHNYHTIPTDSKIIRDTFAFNRRSKRPYVAGQSCNGSITAPVFHLYSQLCELLGLDPVVIYHEAYHDNYFGVSELKEILSFAEWQGVEAISSWNESKIKLVIESIHQVNMHQLANVLSEKL